MSDSPIEPRDPQPIPELAETLPKKQTHRYHLDKAKLAEREWIEANPGIYDIDKLKKWKSLGLDKPEWVTVADWRDCEKALTPIHGVVLHLAAMSMDSDNIAKITGQHTTAITQIINSIHGKEEITRIQDQIWGDDFKKVIQKIIPFAIQTAFTAMVDPKTKAQTKVDAAFKFMDRAMGRPVQQLEINDNLIRSVFEKMDEESKKVVDISAKRDEATALTTDVVASTLQTESDPVEDWVKENL